MTPMKLETEFTVPVSPEQAWRALRDVPAIADALAGERLRDSDGVYHGRALLESDGSRIPVQATLRQIDEDEDEHVATLELTGRQLDGPAVGSVLLSARLEPAQSGARIRLAAEIRSTGHVPAGEAFEVAAEGMLERIAERLRQSATAPPAPRPAASGEPELAVAPSTSAPPPSIVDGGRGRAKLAVAGAGAVLLLAVIRARRRRRGRR